MDIVLSLPKLRPKANSSYGEEKNWHLINNFYGDSSISLNSFAYYVYLSQISYFSAIISLIKCAE